jgi:lysophospholipase L1-like esterase
MAYRRAWQRDFDRSIREHPDWPVVVSQGDSWFSYPHEKNVVDFLDEPDPGRGDAAGKGSAPSQRDWSLLRLERTQDEILGIMTGGERAFLNELLHRYEVDAVLFSAGGNDLLGPDLGALLQPWRAGMAAADGLVERRLTRRLRQIEDCYRELIDMVLDDGADLRVLVNSYDQPVPSCEEVRLLGGRSPGPWLRPAFAAKGYPAGSPLEREIPRLLLDRFCALLDRLSNEVPTRFHRVETRGAVGAEWADEIHPNARGAKAVAERFEKVLQRFALVPAAPAAPVAATRPTPLRAVRKAS